MENEQKKSIIASHRLDRRQFLRMTAVGGTATVVLAACAVPTEAPAGGAQSGAAAAEGGEMSGGTLVFMGHQEVAGLGPDDIGPTVHESVIYNIYNPLVYYNEFVELEYVLAESIDVAEDGSQYTINLREGVLFHNGEELTSNDVKATFDYYRNPDNGSGRIGDFNGIGSVEAPDDYTVIVNMDAPNAASFDTWGSFPIANAAHLEAVGADGYRTDPIGTGPWKLTDYNPAEVVEMEAFDDHFRGRPNIDFLRQEVVAEPSVRFIALQTGDANANVWPLLVEDSIELEADENYIVYRTLANSIKHFPINNQLPQFAEKEVRQALMHAIDRQRLIDDLWSGAAEISHSNLTPKNAFYYRDDLPQYEYDPAKAAEMLDAAGWVVGDDGIREKDGVKLAFTCTTITGDQARRPIAELTQQFFAEIGVDMQLEEAPTSAILEGLREGTLECGLFNWTYGSTPEPDPFSTLHTEGGNNFCNYSNPSMDELIDQGVQIVDPEQRKPIYDEIQAIFVDEVPCLYLQFDEWMNVFDASIQGLPENPLSGDPIFWRAHEWTLTS